MTSLKTLSPYSWKPLTHATLGFDRFFEDIEKILDSSGELVSKYPPHNIIKVDDTHYMVELAVAGFSKDEIDITVEDGVMTITGQKADKTEEVSYLHRGIATRSFTKSLTIAETVEVVGAEFTDGILRIGLENIIPDHKKPKKIEILPELNQFKKELLQE